MTHNEFDHILSSVDALSPEQLQRLRRELDGKITASEAVAAPENHSADVGRDQDHATEAVPADVPMPAWKRIIESMKAVPDEVFDRIPADSSAQLDHYLYDAPKRPTA